MMKRMISGLFLSLTLLSACGQEMDLAPVKEFPSTFTLKEGLELETSPDTYEKILHTVETMVEGDVMEMRVPYHVNLVELDLFHAYEYAYNRAYQSVNATHIEYTSNTSAYQIGYSITAEGEFFITFSRSDKAYTMEEIGEQNRIFREEVDKIFLELESSGRFSYDMAPLDQIKVFFDFTMEYLSYDYSLQPLSFTAYGTVANQNVVCQGYVAMFNSLLKKAGFEVEGVIGESFVEKEGHIWSRVLLDGNWHYFDPTYADRPTFTQEHGELLFNYTYFDMSQETMLYDRTTTHYLVNSDTLVLPS